MKYRRRKKNSNYFILTLLGLFFIFLIITIFQTSFKNIVIEPQSLNNHLKPYFQEKTPYKIYKNIRQIMTDFPEIKKITIRIKPLQRTINLEIKIAKIIAQICDNQKCFYLDDSARIIDSKILIKENLLTINSSLPIENNTLLNPEIKNLFAILFEYANWKPLVLKSIKIYPNFDIGVIDNQNREFLLDPSKDHQQQIKKLEIFLNKNFKATRIDLRINQKIFFK